MVSLATLALAFACFIQAINSSSVGYRHHIVERDSDRTRPSNSPSQPTQPTCKASCHWDPDARSGLDDQCAAVPRSVLLYRAYNADWTDHFYTTDENDMKGKLSNEAFQQEPYAGRVYKVQENGTLPLYRLFNDHLKDHYYTASEAERSSMKQTGYIWDDKIEGYIYQDPICCSIPFYRLKSLEKSDHFYTASEKEAKEFVRRRGYQRNGTVGYILPLY